MQGQSREASGGRIQAVPTHKAEGWKERRKVREVRVGQGVTGRQGRLPKSTQMVCS